MKGSCAMRPEHRVASRNWQKPEMYLDGDTPLKSLRIAMKLAGHYPEGACLMRRSSSRRGWHFWVRGELHNCRRNILLRQAFGDCRGRLRADRIRARLGMPISILFSVNGSKRVGDWEPLDPRKVLEEDFMLIGLQ